MRYVPTSIYIDTQFFISQNLRFDTKVFEKFKNTFVEGGIRLLIPEIMERELLSHFSEKSEEAAQNVTKTCQSYPVNNVIPSIPSRAELVAKFSKYMNDQWLFFQKHFLVEKLPLIGNLEDVVNWYFDVDPPFGSGRKRKEFPDAFIISALDEYHKQHHSNIAIISNDDDFKRACASRRYILQFSSLDDYINAFQPEITGKDLLPCSIDLTKPITTEDLTELRGILGQGDDVTSLEIQRVMDLLTTRGSNYDYFFQKASSAIWISHLSKGGYFLNPPRNELNEERDCRVVPCWPPLDYLIRVFDFAPGDVLDEVRKIEATDNFRVLEGILKIVLKADSPQVVLDFSNHIISYIEKGCYWEYELIIELLKKPFFFDSRLSKVTSIILQKIVEFCPDPCEEEKSLRHKENPDAFLISLEPSPRFEDWGYQKILEKGIYPLAEDDSYKVSRILIDATGNMIRMRMFRDDFEKGGDEDYSEIWCRRLNCSDHNYYDSKESLVNALTYACRQVFEKDSGFIEALDHTLRNQRWKIFKRLRQYLYSLYPNDQTLPWIREFILNNEDYGKSEYHYEFQLMIRSACEHFGSRLLHKREKKAIFDTILGGTPKDIFREQKEGRYDENSLYKRQRYFHRMQLRPFISLLSGEYKSYFDDLEREEIGKPISDESYFPLGNICTGYVSYRSPKSIEELKLLTDNKLLDYLNNWDDVHRDKDNMLLEINISALADVFQTFFRDVILQDKKRLKFWMENRGNVERPIYIVAMIKAMQELVKEKCFKNLDIEIDFCEWILSQPNPNIKGERIGKNDESRKNPDWGSSRQAVVDFINTCIDKNVNAPIKFREGVVNLLKILCTQFDWRLDQNCPVLLNEDDQITEAINNIRSRSLESLINFGFWVRRYLSEDTVPEVTKILETRLAPDSSIKLTRPEYALLGMLFGNICMLNREWALANKVRLFPQCDISLWSDAFCNFLRFNQPSSLTFDILKEDFQFALDRMESLERINAFDEESVDRLGQYLFSYYLWGIYLLKGEDSLLARFYEKTKDKRHYWAHLFKHVGVSLNNSGANLGKKLQGRIVAFCDWRIDVAYPEELQEFVFWLEAECLPSEWRLSCYSKILNLGRIKENNAFIIVRKLRELLSANESLVIECFAKMTDIIDHNNALNISIDDVRPILLAGLYTNDLETRENAESARENLLRNKCFDFLNIE